MSDGGEWKPRLTISARVMIFSFGLMTIPCPASSSPTAEAATVTDLTRDLMYVVMPSSPTSETITVTTYVGNGRSEANPSGLVLETSVLTLTESGTTTGVFRSSAVLVVVTDTVENGNDSDIRLYVTYQDQIQFLDTVIVYEVAPPQRWERSDLLSLSFNPSNRLPPDTNKMWRKPRTAGFDSAQTLFTIGGMSMLCFVWAFYRRHFCPERSGASAGQSEDKSARRNWQALSDFLVLHLKHPSARSVAMELAWRHYRNMDYTEAADYFSQAIRLNGSAKNPEAHFYLAHCYRQLDYLCDAIDEWMACYLDDPDGPLASEALYEARRWRAHQVVEDTEPCLRCDTACRSTDLRCPHCHTDLNRVMATCGMCGRPMVREAKICIHCLPDDIKTEVALGTGWPILKTTALDWEAELIRGRLEAEKIPCVMTGEKGRAIPVTVGVLGEIHIRVPVSDLSDARAASSQD